MTDSVVVVLVSLNDTFRQKHLFLGDSIIPIGRQTSQDTAPEMDNGYFNNKVLSRQHAELWLEAEDGKVYIKDVGSSNGTYVNGLRLSKDNEPSPPRELHDKDTVEFGIDFANEDDVVVYKRVAAQVIIKRPTSNSPNLLNNSLNSNNNNNLKSSLNPTILSEPALLRISTAPSVLTITNGPGAGITRDPISRVMSPPLSATVASVLTNVMQVPGGTIALPILSTTSSTTSSKSDPNDSFELDVKPQDSGASGSAMLAEGTGGVEEEEEGEEEWQEVPGVPTTTSTAAAAAAADTTTGGVSGDGSAASEFVLSRLQGELKRALEMGGQMEALQKRLNQLSFLKSRIPQAKELANMQDNLELVKGQLSATEEELQLVRKDRLRETTELRTRLHRLSLLQSKLGLSERKSVAQAARATSLYNEALQREQLLKLELNRTKAVLVELERKRAELDHQNHLEMEALQIKLHDEMEQRLKVEASFYQMEQALLASRAESEEMERQLATQIQSARVREDELKAKVLALEQKNKLLKSCLDKHNLTSSPITTTSIFRVTSVAVAAIAVLATIGYYILN